MKIPVPWLNWKLPRHCTLPFIVVIFFLLFFFVLSISFAFGGGLESILYEWFRGPVSFPNFRQYVDLRVLSSDDYLIDVLYKRVIIIGDIHGQPEPFHALISKVSYNPSNDTLIHLGDLVGKGSILGSLDVLAYMASNNAIGVRGNHDEMTVEWRKWQDWIETLPDGNKWLQYLDTRLDEVPISDQGDPDEDATRRVLRGNPSWRWKRMIPPNWVIFDDHYRLARLITREQFNYLASLPVVIHVPSAHTFIVHAGLAPFDPAFKQSDLRQPLSHLPFPGTRFTINTNSISATDQDIPHLRLLQEQAVLRDIVPNTDPWLKLNMRTVRRHQVGRGHKGKPISDIWNKAMSRCEGGKNERGTRERELMKSLLPCWPIMLVYGHAATKGLDIQRWALGIDSNLINEGRLTVLILSPESPPFLTSPSERELDFEDKDLQNIPYGDRYTGRIVSVGYADEDDE